MSHSENGQAEKFYGNGSEKKMLYQKSGIRKSDGNSMMAKV